jgi:hypothetical protein
MVSIGSVILVAKVFLTIIVLLLFGVFITSIVEDNDDGSDLPNTPAL